MLTATATCNNNNNNISNSDNTKAQLANIKRHQPKHNSNNTANSSYASDDDHKGDNSIHHLLLHEDEGGSLSLIGSSNSNCSTPNNNNNNKCAGALQNAHVQQMPAQEFDLINKEMQELKVRMRKLQLEIDEKNEIINLLREELETIKEQSDKFQQDNLLLVKDAKRVKILQDENDFLQDKLAGTERFEVEIKRLTERLGELDYLKLRVGELEDDRNKAQEETRDAERQLDEARAKLSQLANLDAEVNKWKRFSHELEQDRASLQTKLLESIDNESRLHTDHKRVEDELRRLRAVIKALEEQRDEEHASTSLEQQLAANGAIAAAAAAAAEAAAKQQQQEEEKLQDAKRQQEEQQQQLKEEHAKQMLEQQQRRADELAKDNEDMRAQLECDKKTINELRQDLACEKTLAQRLTKQLANFTKQIKHFDQHYFPIHDTTPSKKQAQQQQQGEKQNAQDKQVECDNNNQKPTGKCC